MLDKQGRKNLTKPTVLDLFGQETLKVVQRFERKGWVGALGSRIHRQMLKRPKRK